MCPLVRYLKYKNKFYFVKKTKTNIQTSCGRKREPKVSETLTGVCVHDFRAERSSCRRRPRPKKKCPCPSPYGPRWCARVPYTPCTAALSDGSRVPPGQVHEAPLRHATIIAPDASSRALPAAIATDTRTASDNSDTSDTPAA